MRLQRNQLCPIHRSLACRGREPVPKDDERDKWVSAALRIPNHPRGYCEICSNAEMRKLMDRKQKVKYAEK
jgi:hypothetical protein